MDPGLRREDNKGRTGVSCSLEDNDQIPLFDAEKQQKPPVPALRSSNYHPPSG
jgi:hypothetical protein